MNVLLVSSIALGGTLLFVYLCYFLTMRQFRKRGVSWKRSEISPKISLIIATYNEEATLPSKLRNVLELNYPRELLELVIIDSGSTDNTIQVVEDFKKRNPAVNLIFIGEKERQGKSHALNIAYPRASG